MYFVVAADTDVGTVKTTNQDSVCVKIAETPYGQTALAMICDGMGGLEKGELASATVINEFGNWFVNELPSYIDNFNCLLGFLSRITGSALKNTDSIGNEYQSDHTNDNCCYDCKDKTNVS